MRIKDRIQKLGRTSVSESSELMDCTNLFNFEQIETDMKSMLTDKENDCVMDVTLILNPSASIVT